MKEANNNNNNNINNESGNIQHSLEQFNKGTDVGMYTYMRVLVIKVLYTFLPLLKLLKI